MNTIVAPSQQRARRGEGEALSLSLLPSLRPEAQRPSSVIDSTSFVRSFVRGPGSEVPVVGGDHETLIALSVYPRRELRSAATT